MAQLIDGKQISAAIKDELKAEVASYKEQGISICLAVIQVGNDESRIYVEDINHPREFRDTIISAIYELQQEDMHKQSYQKNATNSQPQYQQPQYQQPQYQQPQYPNPQYPQQNNNSNYGSSYQDDYNSDNNYHKPYDPDGF